MPELSTVKDTMSNGRKVPIRFGPRQTQGRDAPVDGSTAPMALLEAPFRVLKAPPRAIVLVPSSVVAIAFTGPSVTGAQAELNAPVIGFTEAALAGVVVKGPPGYDRPWASSIARHSAFTPALKTEVRATERSNGHL